MDTAPEPGSTFADSVSAAVDPSSPLPARRILNELVATAPAAAADVDTRVSVTFDPKASPSDPEDLLDAVAELGRVMEGLASRLGTCGVTVLGRATAAETISPPRSKPTTATGTRQTIINAGTRPPPAQARPTALTPATSGWKMLSENSVRLRTGRGGCL